MEKLVVIFAGGYFAAQNAFAQLWVITLAWQSVFEVAAKKDNIVLKHLHPGINAHIYLDLRITAAISQGKSIIAMKNDFDKFGDIIAAVTNVMKKNLIEICFSVRLLTTVNLNSAK